MKLIKLILLLIVLIPSTFLAVLYFTPERIDFSKYQPQMEKYIKDNSGYQVSLGDELKIRIFPQPHFSSKNIEVKAFSGEKPLFSAKSIQLDFAWENLLAMKVGLEKVLVTNPNFFLQKNINGEANWEPKRKKKSTSNRVDLSFLESLGHVVISNAEFVYEDDMSGQQYNLKDSQFSISGEKLQTTKLQFTGLLNAKPIESELTLDLTSLIETSVMGYVKISDNQINLKGFIDEILIKPSYKGELNVEGEDVLSSIYEIIHIAPNQRSFNAPLKLNGLVEVSSDFIKLNNYNIQIDTSPTILSFDVMADYWFVKSSNVNSIKISSSETLDFSALDACKVNEVKSKNEDFSWSETIMDFDAISNLNLSLDIELLKGLKCKLYETKYVKIRTLIEPRKVKVSQLKIEMPKGGSVRGTLNLDTTSTPRGNVSLTLNKLNLADLSASKQVKRFTLPAESEINLEFNGRTMKDWVSNLSGTVHMNSDGVVLYGVSIASLTKMLTNVLVGNILNTEVSEDYGKFSFDAEIENGVLRSDNISLVLSDADIVAKGKADLVRMTMNFRAVPNPENKLGFKNPVTIKGPITSPSIIPETTTTQKVGAAVGGAVGGPAGAALGGVLGAILENGSKEKDVSKTEVDEDDIFLKKQRLQEEVLQFLKDR